MNFTQGAPALMLKYQTSIPLADRGALTQEVDEIWERFVVDAERRGFQSAIVSANEPPTGSLVTRNSAYNFVYVRGKDYWLQYSDPAKITPIQSKMQVEEFVRRVDNIFNGRLWNALVSLMADDWMYEGRDSNDRSKDIGFVDRVTFIKVTQQAYASATVKRRREIVSVAIAADGLSATVESREFTELDLADRQISGVERSVDLFEMRGDQLFWKTSKSVTERSVETKKN